MTYTATQIDSCCHHSCLYIPAFWNMAQVSGCKMRLTPPTRAPLNGSRSSNKYFHTACGLLSSSSYGQTVTPGRRGLCVFSYRPCPCLVCPKYRAKEASWQATSDEEQAVSTVTAGPLSPNVNESRPLATESVAPVGAIQSMHYGIRWKRGSMEQCK